MIHFWDKEALKVMPDRDEMTALWTGKGSQKLSLLDAYAEQDGFCYLRAVAFFCDFARMQDGEFTELIMTLRIKLGPRPRGNRLLTELVYQFLQTFASVYWATDKQVVDWVCSRAGHSRVKVPINLNENLCHMPNLGGNPFCECSGPLCIHGWSFRMFICMTVDKQVGASNFDMTQFLNERMYEERGSSEDAFEEVYSQLDPGTEQVESSKRNVDSWQQPPKPVIDPKDLEIGELRKRLQEAEGAKVQQMSPPTSPRPLFTAPKSEFTVGPNDSSSVYSRYNRHFMNQGTVMTMRPADNSQDQREGRQVLTVDNMLVSGFEMTEPVAMRQEQSMARLKPINGIPRPFSSARLNFLANLHTGIERAMGRRPGPVLEAMYRVMRSRPHLPCDELLYQVLTTTFDRASGTYCSNFFKLPYIEVGMQLTEDSVVKVFDLLKSEYKILWFQELKNVMIPNFYKDYESIPRDMVSEGRTHKRREPNDQVKRSKSRSSKPRSLLGF